MGDRRFIGSTPEKIIEVNNKEFNTNAIAGTLRKNQENPNLKKFLAQIIAMRLEAMVVNWH